MTKSKKHHRVERIHKFVKHYESMTRPLTNMVKKETYRGTKREKKLLKH